YPDYYELIEKPISMLRIQAWAARPLHYQTLAEYQADWHLLFDNARRYNTPGSQIYRDADLLQKV
ncbi:Bromodomain-containing protein, partial [Mycena polygramma]